MKVLIPTSGYGTRAGDVTKYTSKSLLKVGDKPVISHIIDSYPGADFVITLGHFGDHVRQYLTLAYPEKNFEFFTVDPYQGPGSSLLKSISFARDALQCPFIFHVSDTIIEKTAALDHNWMACAVSNQADLFRTVQIQDQEITKINEKGEPLSFYDLAYTGVAGIHDYKDFWSHTEWLLANTAHGDLGDCHVFSRMLSTKSIRKLYVHKWCDTGSVENLEMARKQYPTKYAVLDKHEEAIYFLDNMVIKFFADSHISKNRVLRASALGEMTPKIVDSTANFYKYVLVKGDLLARTVTEDRLEALINWATDNLWTNVTTDEHVFRENCRSFYKDKTADRVRKYLHITGDVDESEIINGIQIPSYAEMENQINWQYLSNTGASGFHGDFVLDNILHNGDDFTLLDWRQDFAGRIDAGDKYYDLAKLSHNLILNHDIILNNGFTIDTTKEGTRCDILRSQRLVMCEERFFSVVKKHGHDINKIKLIRALIWINMAPLHMYPFNKFLFYFGKYNLWRQLCKTN